MNPTRSEPTMTLPLLFLVNPAAGAGAGRRVGDAIRAMLQNEFPAYSNFCDIEMTDPADPGGQARRACAAYSTIVAVGGDGTASWILQGIMEAGAAARFGLIPLGTGNDLARSLEIFDPGISRSPEQLHRTLASLFQGRTSAMDLLRIDGGRIFCNYAGMGMDARVLSGYKALSRKSWFALIRWSRFLKFLAYGLFLVRHLRYRLPPGIRVSAGTGDAGPGLDTGKGLSALIVSNTSTYAGGFPLQAGSRLDDGRFEVTLVRGIPDILRILCARLPLFRGLLSSLQKVQTDHLAWSAPPGIPLEWDGELSPEPLPEKGSIRCVGPIQVILPPGRVKDRS